MLRLLPRAELVLLTLCLHPRREEYLQDILQACIVNASIIFREEDDLFLGRRRYYGSNEPVDDVKRMLTYLERCFRYVEQSTTCPGMWRVTNRGIGYVKLLRTPVALLDPNPSARRIAQIARGMNVQQLRAVADPR